MIHHYAKVIRKDIKLIFLVFIFISLGVVATMLAGQCDFFQCLPSSSENPPYEY